MQLVILAGGKGTRLRERLNGLPKPLVDICGVPLLERQILLAKRHGFTDVLVLVNHAAEHIIEYCASRRNWGLNVRCVDDGQPRGTAGATLAVLDLLACEFLVMYGDTMLDVDLAHFHSYHSQVAAGVAATLFLHPNDHPHDSDLVEMDESGRITGFHPYPHDQVRYYPNLVNAALYWVTKAALEPWRDEQRILDFGKDLFPAMLARGMTLRGFNSPEYIKDIGTPYRLDKVCADFRSGRIARASRDQPKAMVFVDRDGTVNREVNHLDSPDRFELLPGVEDAIKRLNHSDYRCCIVTNQPVVARGECSYEGLRQIHNKMETLLGRHGAFVDRIYYCPHHPDAGFPGERTELKIDCGCRKPKSGMINQAVQELNIDLEHSWFVGDSTVDVETARRAGVRSILVETGYAGLDYRSWAMPDFIVPDLEAAVSFILDQYPRLATYCSGLAGEIGKGAIVLVGGQARSGKSTFASVLRDSLRAGGKNALVLSADRWLKSERDRGRGVLGRFDMAALQALVNDLGDRDRRPKHLSLAGYNKLKRERVASVESISVSASDIILIEGVVALALEIPVGVEARRFHVTIDEEVRKIRFLGEYRMRGLDDKEAMAVYLARRDDEVPAIEKLAGDASRVSLSSV